MEQADLKDIWTAENLGMPGSNEAIARLVAKYGQEEFARLIAKGGPYDNPCLQGFARCDDATLLGYMNHHPFAKYAEVHHYIGFTSWADALTKIGRAYLVPQLTGA